MSDLESQGDKSQSTRSEGSRFSGKAYEGAFEAVASILICAGFGYWADATWDTEPRYLLIGFVVGFGAFVLRLYRLGVAMQARFAEEAELLKHDKEAGPGPPRSEL